MNTSADDTAHIEEKSEKLSIPLVFGPTAVGKTAFLSALPDERFEVISADSRQVYRYLDIGTAKPEPGLLEVVPHHLIDICDPSEQYTAGRFVRDAERLARDIRSRGRTPIMVGGTGYYLKNFMYGLPESPISFPGIREEVQGELRTRGAEALYRDLCLIDPETASRISPSDGYRICRAHEVYRGTGSPLSSFRVPDTLRTDLRVCCIYLDRERSQLYRRIDLRVDEMFSRGLVDELKHALSLGFDSSDPGLRTIGYAELLSAREGCMTLHEARELIKRNSRRYAKRQGTFFRSLPVDLYCSADDHRSVLDAIDQFCDPDAALR